MGEVDPGDDTVTRFVVRHFRYDAERTERRHVVVAVYDDQLEFEARMRVERARLDDRRAAGESVEPREYISGTVHEAGHARRAANGRLVVRSFRHGVTAGPWLDELELPPDLTVTRTPNPGEGS